MDEALTDDFTPLDGDPALDDADALEELDRTLEDPAGAVEDLRLDQPDPPPPLGRSWRFDFAAGQFQRSSARSPLETHGVQTLLGWVEKCLHTERGSSIVHPPDYGLRDAYGLVGLPVTDPRVADLEDRVREALIFHPRIADVTDFTADYDSELADDALWVEFVVVLDDESQVPVSTSLGA